MKKDFIEYLPYIVVVLLIVSSSVIYARGGFDKPKAVPTLSPVSINETTTPTPTIIQAVLPTNLPTTTPTLSPTNTPTPVSTTPSIQRRRGGEDD